ncbi:MAG: exodeoxyribonuclease V subunit alpha [Nitriliruptoraceae bacterium]
MTTTSTPVEDLRDLELLTLAEWHASEAITRLVGDDDPLVALAVALATRAVRQGHVCLELDRLVEQGLVADDGSPIDLALPALPEWRASLAASPAVRQPTDDHAAPLVLDANRLYLDRYWRHEQRLADGLLAAFGHIDDRDPDDVANVLDTLFDQGPETDMQRRACDLVTQSRLTVLTGGPGTGKTTTVVRMLAVLAATARQDAPPRMVLAAPTGKAAARMMDTVREGADALPVDDKVTAALGQIEASTLHRLLGANPSRSTRFRYDATNPLPYDVVVVDEASMVSLPLMARLVDALDASARLVLVGDREQLVSVDAGAVLADVAAGGRLASSQIHLTHTFRFGAESGISHISRAIERGDADEVLAAFDGRFDDVHLVSPTDGALDAVVWEMMIERGRRLQTLASDGAAPAEVLRATDAFRVLAPLRRGPMGVEALNRRIAAALAAEFTPVGSRGHEAGLAPAVGTPVIVTRNDHAQRLYNGDVGVVVHADRPSRRALAFWDAGGDVRLIALARLPRHELVHAMSVHRSQGSQFDEVVVVLPAVDTPLLTRELIYTAATRARCGMTVVASEDVLRHAIGRRVQRASGLRSRLA